MSSDSWLLVWEGSILLVDEGVSPCLVMSPANLVVKQVMERMTVIMIYDLTEFTICKKATSSMAVIH